MWNGEGDYQYCENEYKILHIYNKDYKFVCSGIDEVLNIFYTKLSKRETTTKSEDR